MKQRGRLLSWLATSVVVGSVIVFVLVVGFGVRSYFRGDFLGYTAATQNESDMWGISTENGQVRAHRMRERWQHARSTSDRGWSARSWVASHPSVIPPGSFGGFKYDYEESAHDSDQLFSSNVWIAVPYWFIALLSLPAPLMAFRRYRRRRKLDRAGLCPVCGYDLRASASRCPECGTAFGSGA